MFLVGEPWCPLTKTKFHSLAVLLYRFLSKNICIQENFLQYGTCTCSILNVGNLAHEIFCVFHGCFRSAKFLSIPHTFYIEAQNFTRENLTWQKFLRLQGCTIKFLFPSVTKHVLQCAALQWLVAVSTNYVFVYRFRTI